MKIFFAKKEVKKWANRGFTLVEMLVAVSILLISITGPLIVASQILSYSYFARDQIAAFYLAQDALEFIHNRRDENGLVALSGETVNWLNGLSSCKAPAKCRIDSLAGTVAACDGADASNPCDYLKFDANSGVYSYGAGDNSKFIREVTLAEGVADTEAVAAVTIKWSAGIFRNQSFTVSDNIYNWQQP